MTLCRESAKPSRFWRATTSSNTKSCRKSAPGPPYAPVPQRQKAGSAGLRRTALNLAGRAPAGDALGGSGARDEALAEIREQLDRRLKRTGDDGQVLASKLPSACRSIVEHRKLLDGSPLGAQAVDGRGVVAMTDGHAAEQHQCRVDTQEFTDLFVPYRP